MNIWDRWSLIVAAADKSADLLRQVAFQAVSIFSEERVAERQKES